MESPASQRSVPLAGGRLGSGLRPQHSQGEWAESSHGPLSLGRAVVTAGVAGAPEMPGCLPGAGHLGAGHLGAL